MSASTAKNKQSNTLQDEVALSPHYQRSINLKHDFGAAESFDAFICHGSAQTAIDSFCIQISSSKQRAFTFTGPYGGGKSSLLNLLASSVCRKPSIREQARRKLDKRSVAAIKKALPCTDLGWSVVPVVGSRTQFESALCDAIGESQRTNYSSPLASKRKKTSSTIDSIVDWIRYESAPERSDGVLILIDEMGKFLEGAARGEGDLLAFQTLAETVSRMDGRVVIIGALHQAISAYGSENLDEWRKVQGRFADIPFVTRTDEVVELIGRAITNATENETVRSQCKKISQVLTREKPSLRSDFDDLLYACRPFHPVTASLLGPISRRQYGQNERSIFAFLSTPDAYSFTDFLRTQPSGSQATYTPAHLWDYLYANLDPAITASSDGHRWASAVETVSRAEAKVDAFALSVVKNVAVIDLFKKQSALMPTIEILSTLYQQDEVKALPEVLVNLCEKRILAFRRHQDAYAIFEGSDFDIEQALKESKRKFQRPDLSLIRKYVNTNPVVAKRHYMERGTLRWLSVHLVFADELRTQTRSISAEDGFGEVLIILPESVSGASGARQQSVATLLNRINHPALGFAPVNAHQIVGFAVELMGLQDVLTTAQELHGDSIGRKEVTSRIADMSQRLESELLHAFEKAKWESNRELKKGSMSEMASSLADAEYPLSPIVFNELVNRDNLSTNAVKARKLLHYAIEEKGNHANLGFEGFPAERGLYESILKGRLHFGSDGGYSFKMPTNGDAKDKLWVTKLWNVVQEALGDGRSITTVDAIYDTWSQPPFGIKSGLAPILLHAMVEANKKSVALYRDGVFCTKFKEAYIDEFLTRPKRFGLRAVGTGDDMSLSDRYGWLNLGQENLSELNIARELVRRVLILPKLTLQTERVSSKSRVIRDAIKNANDPHKLINEELPTAVDCTANHDFCSALKGAFGELETYYDSLLRSFKETLLKDLEARESTLETLRSRAARLQTQAGDFKMNSFVMRLATWAGDDATLESMLSLAIGKPNHLWRDLDITSGLLTIKKWIAEFKELELITSTANDPVRQIFQVVIGTGVQRQPYFGEISMLTEEVEKLDLFANQIYSDLLQQMGKKGITADRILPIISLVGKKILESGAE